MGTITDSDLNVYTLLESTLTDAQREASIQKGHDTQSSASEIDASIIKFISPYQPTFLWSEQALPNIIENSYVDSSGNVQALSEYTVSSYIPVVEGNLYLFNMLPTAGQSLFGGWYNSSQVWIANFVDGIQVAPVGATYLRVNIEDSVFGETMILGETTQETRTYKSFAFLGDSITQGNAPVGLNTDEIYLNVIKDKLGLDSVINYGASGTHISSYAGYANESGTGAVRYRAMENDVDGVVVFMGTNDYGHTDTAPIGTMADRTNISFYGGLHVLCKGLTEKYLGKPVFFATPLHRDGDSTNNVTTATNLLGYVEIIKEVCEFYGIEVIDLFSEVSLNPTTNIIDKSFFGDGIHPNKYGHKVIADKILKHIV